MHYLIYIPGDGRPDPGKLTEAGFPDSFLAGALMKPLQRNEGCRGVLVSWEPPPTDKDVLALQWTQLDDIWMIHDPEHPPTPDELALLKQYPGHVTELADGQQYLVPAWTRLDFGYVRGNGGEVLREPQVQWRDFCDRTQVIINNMFVALGMNDLLKRAEGRLDIANQIASEDIKEVEIEEGISYACAALGINYRINMDVGLTLGLFNNSSLTRVMAAACDLNHIRECLEQKKRPDSVSIPVG